MLSNPTSQPTTRVEAAMRVYEAGIQALRDAGFDELSKNPDCIDLVHRFETGSRTTAGFQTTLIAKMQEQWIPGELGDYRLADVLADTLRIYPSEAKARRRIAEDLGPRTGFSGAPLDPVYPNTAAAHADGAIGRGHITVIREFFAQVPSYVDAETREQAEAKLAEQARILRPDQLRRAGNRILAYLNPDGDAPEVDRERKRSFTLGKQGTDLMTKGSFCVDPELRAYLEALFAKYAKPGVGNPADTDSTVDTEPADEVAQRDTRSVGQRQHDGLKMVLRDALASGTLGQHRGLPVTVVATMTVKELEDATRQAITGGGSLLPIRDVVRMAAHAHHYLALFDDDGRPIYLGRSKRIAQGDQRLVCYARDKGCTFPACWRPANCCQCHHCREWVAELGLTDVDQLALVCDSHHRLAGVKDTDWHTIVAGPDHKYPGRILWVPPKHIDPTRKPRINHYFHPHEYWDLV
ncbi:HNH endonuclease signature motif containing protein [Antrihabitans spumae]|uniref:HNH endonuclease signature motif containing protein n=1 Tax=Antrihabitans spumae TaxID=3373370 RepID=A0ABW7KJD5_9NOCA